MTAVRSVGVSRGMNVSAPPIDFDQWLCERFPVKPRPQPKIGAKAYAKAYWPGYYAKHKERILAKRKADRAARRALEG